MKRKIAFHRNNKKLIWKSVLLVFGSIVWIAAILNQTYLSDYHDAVSVRYQEPLLTAQELEYIIRDMISKEDYNIPEITLWQRDEGFLLTNEGRNTSVSVGLITVSGDMTKAYANSMLYGSYLSKGDYDGCVIDRNTAYQLFHSENAVGLTISLNNRDYTICGILQEMGSNTMIIQEERQVVSKQEGKKYSCMELAYSDTENAKYLAENFIRANSLGTPVAYIDGYMYQKLSYLLIHIPLWFSAVLLIQYFARRVNKLKGSRILFVSGWFGIILLSAILIRITKVRVYYSSSMLPTHWSDFEFWGNQWKLFQSSIRHIEGSIIYYNDILLIRRMGLVLGGAMFTVISQALLLKQHNR
jgi:hypothetical protein